MVTNKRIPSSESLVDAGVTALPGSRINGYSKSHRNTRALSAEMLKT